MTSATIIELDEISAGIVVQESRGFRFFAAGSPFHRLEGTSFRSIEQAKRAARALLRGKSGPFRREGAKAGEGDARPGTGAPRPPSPENDALFSVFCGLTVPY